MTKITITAVAVEGREKGGERKERSCKQLKEGRKRKEGIKGGSGKERTYK
jgi:hypothetical protein